MKRITWIGVVTLIAVLAMVLPGQAHHGPNHQGGPNKPTPTPTATPTPTPTPTPTDPPPPDPTVSAACTNATTQVAAPVGGLAAATATARAENAAGRSVCVRLAPGALYREVLLLNTGTTTTAAIVVEGQGARLNGADVFDFTAAGPGRYTTSWSHNLGDAACPSGWPCQLIDPATFAREALFVGASKYVVVDQVTELIPGTFYVDETNDLVTVAAKPADEPITAAEITVRRPLVEVRGRTNVTIRNLTVERGAGNVLEAQIYTNGTTDLDLTNIVTTQAAGAGIDTCCSTRPELRNVDARDNGIIGLGFGFNSHLLVEDTDNIDNNWRGAHTGYLGWATDKFYNNDDVTIRRWTATGNQSHGIWFDWDNERVLVEDSVMAGNVGRGAFIEANEGPLTFRNVTVCNNGFGGMAYARSNFVTVEDSRIFDNRRWQHYGTGQGAPFTAEGTLVDGYNFTLRNTVTRASDLWPDDTGGWLYSMGTQEETGWHASNTFVGNQWYSVARSAPFLGGPGAMTYAQFAAHVGETGGSYADPSTLVCPAPRHPNAQDQPNGW